MEDLFKYEVLAPEAALRPFVQDFWILKVERTTTPVLPVRTFVDDSSGIVIEFSLNKNEPKVRRAMFYGQTTSPTQNTDNMPFAAFGVRFHPSAIKELWGIDAHELTNQRISVVELADFPSIDMISTKGSFVDIVRVFSDYLTSKAATVKHQNDLLRHCIRNIKDHVGNITVKALCSKYNISERQLERKFLQIIGVTPRHYIKTCRFQDALAQVMRNPNKSLTEIAHQLGYFDQAHFIKQVKELSGLSPKVLRSKLNTTVANIIL